MKISKLMMVLLLMLLGCAHSSESQVGDITNQFLENLHYELSGYDSQCVSSVKGMVKEGKISPSEANYLINRTFKRPEPPSHPLQLKSNICPVCGSMGMPSLYSPEHYVCPKRHSW